RPSGASSSPKTPSHLPANLCKKPKIRPGGFPVFTIGAGCVTMQSVITASLYHSIVIEAGSAADGKEEHKMSTWKEAVSLLPTGAMALARAACGCTASSASGASGAASAAASSEAESAADSAAASANVASSADSDLAYVQDKGTLVVGMTDFAPMDYRDENG